METITAKIIYLNINHDNSIPGCRYKVEASVSIDGQKHDVKLYTNDSQYYDYLFDEDYEEKQKDAAYHISKLIVNKLENDLNMISGSIDKVNYTYLGLKFNI